jgi:hypothetical protein
MLVSVASCLPGRCFLQGPDGWKMPGPPLPAGLVSGCGASAESLQTTLSTVWILHIFVCVVHLHISDYGLL